jgi:DNA-binding ferritin-like protein
MLAELVEAYKTIIRDICTTLNQLNGLQDYASEDLLIQWLKLPEKRAWLLRNYLLYTPET